MTQIRKEDRDVSGRCLKRGGNQSFLHVPEDNYKDPLKEKANTAKQLLRERHITNIRKILERLIENSEGASLIPVKALFL
jgi:hypothetical protein